MPSIQLNAMPSIHTYINTLSQHTKHPTTRSHATEYPESPPSTFLAVLFKQAAPQRPHLDKPSSSSPSPCLPFRSSHLEPANYSLNWSRLLLHSHLITHALSPTERVRLLVNRSILGRVLRLGMSGCEVVLLVVWEMVSIREDGIGEVCWMVVVEVMFLQ